MQTPATRPGETFVKEKFEIIDDVETIYSDLIKERTNNKIEESVHMRVPKSQIEHIPPAHGMIKPIANGKYHTVIGCPGSTWEQRIVSAPKFFHYIQEKFPHGLETHIHEVRIQHKNVTLEFAVISKIKTLCLLRAASADPDLHQELIEWFAEDFDNRALLHPYSFETKQFHIPEQELLSTEHHSLEAIAMDIALELETLQQMENRVIIANIAGGSGSGKTTLAKMVQQHLHTSSTRVTLDNFCIGRKRMAEKNIDNFDTPECYDEEALFQAVQCLRSNQDAVTPKYCKIAEEPVGTSTVKASPIILIEGLFALREPLAHLADKKIFVSSGAMKEIRRLMRDTVEEFSMGAWGTHKYLRDVAWPLHAKFIEPTRAHADLIVENETMNEKLLPHM